MSTAAQKIYQVGGFLLLMSMLFLALSVGSYSSGDPTWNHYMSRAVYRDGEIVRNLGGIVGASLADWGVQSLGSAAVLFVGIGGLMAWRIMHGHITGAATVAWRGGVLLVAISTGIHCLFGRDPFFGPQVPVGGIIGQWIAATLVHYLNLAGAYLVLLTAVILALFVGIETSTLSQKWHTRLLRVRHSMHGVLLWMKRGIIGLIATGQWVKETLKRWVYAVAGEDQDDEAWPCSPVEADWEADRSAVALAEAPFPPQEARYAPLASAPVVTSVSAGQANEDRQARTSPPMRDHVPAIDHVPVAAQPPIRTVSPAAVVPPASARRSTPQPQTFGALPSLGLLDSPAPAQRDQSPEDLKAQAMFLELKLRDFGVEGEVVQVLPGPVITMYEFAPAPGVKVSKIANLQDDLALVMRALSVRVVAPVPGKAVVGIEIPNRRRETVRLRELLDSEEFRASTSMLTLVLGKDILGKPVVTDLALIPHLLIAGATGSGKSVGLNSMICSLLFRATPVDVRMIMIDPKMLELSIYDGIPHLLIPVVTNPKKAAVALRRVVEEMERRYQLMAARGVRSIAQYNQVIANAAMADKQGLPPETADQEPLAVEKLPYLVVVIDELSDLMMVSSREVEDSLTRIAQMARAAGIHLIVATQRPSVDVLTGVIKANFPARVSFQVSSKTDSRTILDANGAEKLLGRGDMLFLAPGTSKPQRIHGAYVSETEINRLVASWKDMEQPHYDDSFLVPSNEQTDMEDEEYDEKYDEAIALVARIGQASISMLQRRLRVGYNRAARMIEIMEKEGIIGPADGVKPREVLVRREYDEE
jgi:S-DNA-T family DNA segregation ATPase FtsK/SpoIIIE